MERDLNQAMTACLQRLVRPVIRFCLKRSLSIQSLIACVKAEYISMAAEELRSAGQKVNVSRLSAATGIRRKEIDRLLEEHVPHNEYFGFAPRVIAKWRRDKRFLTKGNQPRMLSCVGSESDFAKLVRAVSTDFHPRAVLTDLERLGVITVTDEGVKLHARAYRPEAGTVESFNMLAADVDDLVYAVLDNFAATEKELPNYHARTFFDNIDSENLPTIRRWLFKECSRLQLKAEKYLSSFDRDINPKQKKVKVDGTRARVALGMFTKT